MMLLGILGLACGLLVALLWYGSRASLGSGPRAAGYFALGLMHGSTLAYLLCVLLGALLPSWPFNAFFTPLALVLQGGLWMRLRYVDRYWVRHGTLFGIVPVFALWLFYVQY